MATAATADATRKSGKRGARSARCLGGASDDPALAARLVVPQRIVDDQISVAATESLRELEQKVDGDAFGSAYERVILECGRSEREQVLNPVERLPTGPNPR